MELEVKGVGYQRSLEIKTHVRLLQLEPMLFTAKLDRSRDDFFSQSIKLDNWDKPADNNETPSVLEAVESPNILVVDEVNMTTLREVAINFSRLTLSQKSKIAGKLELISDDDLNQPEFEKFRRVLLRAKDRGLIERLKEEIDSL